mmetsp:Transcript_7857/g.20277  ORF Transcript_7857/g.20277 Transcript_7857/m.20277 type:complete len:365 (-) Transcript_7857:74-1168(-)
MLKQHSQVVSWSAISEVGITPRPCLASYSFRCSLRKCFFACCFVPDGPPRFASPILSDPRQEQERAHLPLMLYLPGLDGSGICAARQYPLLQKCFDLRKLVIPLTDRTPFPQLVAYVEDYLQRETEDSTRPVYILGESFGGILSLAVAAELGERVDRVVLVNPATSFPRSIWPSFGPVLSQLPSELYNAAPFALVPLLGDPFKMASFYTPLSAAPPEQAEFLAQGLVNMLPLLGMLSDLLPADTLEWKIDILGQGASYTEAKLSKVTQPVLVIAGSADLLVPSEEESMRLEKLLAACSRRVLPGHSHLLMQEQGVDIAQIIKEEGYYSTTHGELSPILRSTGGAQNGEQSSATGPVCPLTNRRM